MSDGDKHDLQRLGAAVPADAPLICPECGAAPTAADYESHLREVHRLFLFRGARRPYTETLAHLLNLLTAVPPDADAWEMLTALMRREQGARASTVLAALLGALLTRVDGERGAAALDALAELLARDDDDARLTAALAAGAETTARRLALALIARQKPPFDPALLQPLRRLLLDRRLPPVEQFAALAALLCSAGPDSPLAPELLSRLVKGLPKAQAVERLREFERLHGSSPAVDALCAALEERMRMSCPRCSISLRRRKMIRHLWDEHRLILDGRRVRDPWAVVESWIIEYRATGDAALL